MADNIIGNGSLRTPVISGSLSLPYSDLYLLIDQGTSISGISLTGETVYIEADLSNRLNITDIRFYLDSVTSSGVILGNLNFAYKNYEEDNYIYLDKNYNPQYFYADNLTQDFSPRYIRFDITATTCELLEFEIYANDDIVDFGEDGLLTEYIIADIPIDEYNIIPIYNNHSSQVANAYAVIEYTGAASDAYIELYDSQAFTFYNINDGFIVKDNSLSSDYIWNQGVFTYTKISDNKVILSDLTPLFIFNPDDTDPDLSISNYGLTLENFKVDTWGSGRTHGSLDQGKFYFEVKVDNISASPPRIMVGAGTINASISSFPGSDGYGVGYHSYNGYKYTSNTAYSFGSAYTVNDIIGVAVDVSTGDVWFSKNNVWQAAGDPASGANPAFTKYNIFAGATIYPMIGLFDLSDIVTIMIDSSTLNYTPPAGFTSLVDTVRTTGYYKTPVFTFGNQYAASYITVDSTTNSGITNIGTDLELNTIEVRSSNIEPIGLDEIHWVCTVATSPSYSPGIYFDRYTVYTDYTETNWISSISYTWNTYTNMYATAINIYNGHVIHNWRYNRYVQRAYFRIIDRATSEEIYYDYLSDDYRFDGGMECNYYGALWGYSIVNGILALLDYSSGSMTVVYEIDLGYDFIGDFSAEITGAGIWYTDKTSNSLLHKDGSGNTLLEDTTMTTPRAVCSTSDNGCWVVDNNNYNLRRYNYDGEIIITGNLNRIATKMINDGEDGFFYLSGDYVYHVLSTGQAGISVSIDSPTSIMNGNNIFAVYSNDNAAITIIDKSSGNIVKTVNQRFNYNSLPAIYSINQENHSKSYTNVLPVSYDPVWGTNSGTLEWYTVKKNEYILPKRLYHQVKTTLTTSDYTISPSINGIAVPHAVKIQDIQPQDSKPLYVRTNFTEGATMQDYITNLRVWWEI